jgi:ComF family protein
MLDIFQQLIDSIFPKPEAVKRLEGVTATQVEKYFNLHCQPLFTALTSYETPVIKAAITANKFYKYERAAALLAPLINKYEVSLPPKPTVFIPIPLSRQREKKRGYNQVLRVLQFAKSAKEINIDTRLLQRVIDTAPQTSLHRSERLSNLKGAFVAHLPEPFPYERIIIIDDVVTTGATFKAAKDAIEAKEPKECEIICVALAH